MSDILGIAVSGLNAAATRVANSASNIVNASSTNYQPTDVVSLSNANGGVSTKIVPSGTSGGTNIAGELVSNIENQTTYGANADVVKIDKKLNDTLLNILT